MARDTSILTGDLHVGGSTALTTHPVNEVQEMVLARYRDAIKALARPRRPQRVICNGDAIDGPARKDNDITTSRPEDQAAEAADLLYEWGATEEYIVVAGTKYHTGADGVPLEEMVASKIRERIQQDGVTGVRVIFRRKVKLVINGWFRLEMRHKTGRSTVPHGATTPQKRYQMWNVLNAALGSANGGDAAAWPHLICFGHVHYWNYHEDDFGAVCSLPCWKAIGCEFGDEMCEGHVTLGAMRLRVGPEDTGKGDAWQLDGRRYLAGVVDRWESR